MNQKHWSLMELSTSQEEKLKLSDNPTIRDLANTDPALMQFFSSVIRVIIELSRKVMGESGGTKSGK